MEIKRWRANDKNSYPSCKFAIFFSPFLSPRAKNVRYLFNSTEEKKKTKGEKSRKFNLTILVAVVVVFYVLTGVRVRIYAYTITKRKLVKKDFTKRDRGKKKRIPQDPIVVCT